MEIVKTAGLRKTYKRVPVVNDLGLTVEKGQIYGFLGPNGSGKTTTLGMILGVICPDRGQISLLGSQTPAQLHTARRRVGGLLEQPNFYPYLSGRDNLRMAAAIKGLGGPALPESEIGRVLQLVKLDGSAHKEFRTYSLGMKQRLALASCLLGQPELLILDEPTNGLDPEGMQEIRELILNFAASGLTILLSTHLLYEVERICTHMGIIKQGALLMSCAVAQLLQAPNQYRVASAAQPALLTALAGYYGHGGISGTADQDHALIVLPDRDPARLNRFLAERGIYLSTLAPVASSMEDVFLQMTREQAGAA